jgi:hypothetical protein
MDARRARLVHPAYVEIVKQLCPDEARIFTYLNQYPDKQPEKGLPYFDIHIPARDGYDVIDRNISHLGTDAECEHAELTPSYIDNLCRLELLGKVTEGSYIADPKAYKRLEKDPDIKGSRGRACRAWSNANSIPQGSVCYDVWSSLHQGMRPRRLA